MHWKEAALRQGLKPVDWVNSRRFDNQKAELDELREEKYALIVFDALRYDVALNILPQYLKGELKPVWSAGHDTFEYGEKCWGDREYPATYVSGATPFHRDPGFEDEFFQSLYGGWNPADTLPNLVEAWQECWDTSLGTTDPEKVVETAAEYTDREKLVCHLFQPHAPYIGRYSLLGHTNSEDAKPQTGEPVDKPLWERVKSGDIPEENLKRAYHSNAQRAVEAALPLLKTLCEQEDRRVVVMADHGELLGTLHPKLVSHPRLSFANIRTVPWFEVDGVREYPNPDATVDGDVQEKLQALGYRK